MHSVVGTEDLLFLKKEEQCTKAKKSEKQNHQRLFIKDNIWYKGRGGALQPYAIQFRSDE